MEQYIKQLIEDIRQAHARRPVVNHKDHFESVEAYVYGPEYSMKELSGIAPEALPPPEKLSISQMGDLCVEIRALWFEYNIVFDLPDRIPPRYLYAELRRKWQEEKFPLIEHGHIHIEFCDYVPEECPWPERYCKCREWLDED